MLQESQVKRLSAVDVAEFMELFYHSGTSFPSSTLSN